LSSCCADLVVGTPQIAIVLAAPTTPVVGVALALPAVLAAVPLAAVTSTPAIPVVGGAASGSGGVPGTGAAGQLTIWDTGDTLIGDAGLTWDATNAELDASGPGTNNATVYAEATAVGGVALWGEGGHGSNGAGVTGRGMAVSSYGVDGITTAGVGVRGRATATSGIGVQATTTDAAAIPLQGTAPSGQTADLLQLLVNGVVKFAVAPSGRPRLVSTPPSSATDTGTTGEYTWDANFYYQCIATNTWVRAALSTW
jgi:hypothetical protein